MTTSVALWCRCGGSITVSGNPQPSVLGIGQSFRSAHADEGCEVTEDAATGRRWARAARRSELRVVR